ncbi:hypothetical protein KUG85_04750 [Nitratireductor sp. L1-7-SE]|uniref:Putative DnaT-like domain-containing protein n=1 Tax=Nitratireductor rhodophyticola TaxID=2854036 RepID=A0ABS7RGP7_9HYPH|nr:DnaT-like ssDNA-binding protein [Nitratireductor rhodophyticola]MBY8918818.1 hypothetical protein [Nitratireductor rhodophyticola]MBY8919999.1 hypothetical protein [Nitratireductor rhodophyticola]
MAGYGTDQGFQDWATENGYTVPSGTVAAARQRGSAYIDAVYGDRFFGQPAGGIDQERAWPRVGATDKWGNAIASDVVPLRVVNASYHATLQEMETPGSLEPVVVAAERVKREKVGPLETEYMDGSAGDAVTSATPLLASVEGLLEPLLTSSLNDLAIMVV